MNDSEKRDFEQVYRDYYLIIYKFLLKRLSNKADAESLTSDVFYKAFTHYANYNPSMASEKTWLFVITQNVLKNYYRDNRNNQSIDEVKSAEQLNYSCCIEDAISLQNTRDILAKALKKLPERESKIIILKWFYNKSAEEIGSMLGLSAGNVRTIASRAKKDLKSILTSIGFEWEE